MRCFEEGGLAAELFQRRQGFGLAADQRLSLAVIAEAPRLQDCRQPHVGQRIAQALLVMHVGVVGDGDAEPAHEVLLHETVLGDGEGFRGGMDGRFLPGDLEALRPARSRTRR